MVHKKSSEMKDLENIGWGQMSSILDKEMPLQKRTNRAIIWWSSGAAAAITLLVIGYSVLNTFSEPSLLSNETIPSPIDKVALKEQIKAVTKAATSNDPTKEVNNTSTIVTEEPIIESNTTLSSVHENEKINTNYILSESQNQRTELNSIQFTKQQSNANQGEFKTKESTHLSTNQNYVIEQYDYTKISNKQGIIISTNPPECKQVPVLELTNKPKLRFGINALYTHSSKKKYNEVGLGVRAYLEMNKKWSLASAINFQKRKSVFNRATANDQILDDRFDFSSISGGGSSVLLTEAIQKIKSSQISMHMGAQYKLTPKWSINSSISPSYTIVNVDEYNRFIANSIDPIFENENQLIVNKWNMHWDSGLSYALNSQIGLGINYSHIVTKNGSAPDNNHNFESDEWRLTVHYLLD